jgi:hypothetical protein
LSSEDNDRGKSGTKTVFNRGEQHQRRVHSTCDLRRSGFWITQVQEQACDVIGTDVGLKIDNQRCDVAV